MATKQYKLVHIGNESYAIDEAIPAEKIKGWFTDGVKVFEERFMPVFEKDKCIVFATDPSLNLPLIDKIILVQSESLSYIQSLTPKPVAIEVEMEEKDKQVQFDDGSWDRSYITTSEPIIENNYIKCKAIWK